MSRDPHKIFVEGLESWTPSQIDMLIDLLESVYPAFALQAMWATAPDHERLLAAARTLFELVQLSRHTRHLKTPNTRSYTDDDTSSVAHTV